MASPSDIAHIQEMYDLYVNAEKAILKGQSYSIGDRTLTRADLKDIVSSRKEWGAQLAQSTQLANGNSRVFRVIPRGGQ